MDSPSPEPGEPRVFGPSAAGLAVRSPERPGEWEQMYALRWEILRAPWNQPVGSERDEGEERAFHRNAVTPGGEVVGTGRWQLLEPGLGQVRYMAVAAAWQGKGVGAAVLHSLEEEAVDRRCLRVVLEAREGVVRFYQRAGYQVTRPGKILYGVIPHWWMEKCLG